MGLPAKRELCQKEPQGSLEVSQRRRELRIPQHLRQELFPPS